jgi:protein disulfide-isomerase A6
MSFFTKSKNVKELSSKDFEAIATWKLKSNSCSAVLFYAPWCPHCVNVKDTWETLGKKALFLEVLAFDSEKNKAHLSKIKEDMPGLVQGYPTIVFYTNGKPVEHFEGERTESNLLKAFMRVCQGSTK